MVQLDYIRRAPIICKEDGSHNYNCLLEMATLAEDY